MRRTLFTFNPRAQSDEEIAEALLELAEAVLGKSEPAPDTGDVSVEEMGLTGDEPEIILPPDVD